MLKENFSFNDYFFYIYEALKVFYREIILLMKEFWFYPIYVTADHQKIFVANIVISIVLFFTGVKLAKKLSSKLSKKLPHRFDKHAVSLFRQLFYYFLLLVVTIFVLDISNVPLTAFTLVGTTFAVGIGIGSQHLANNFMSGIIILFEQPIKLGDFIQVKNILGKVTQIGSRCVSIKTNEGIDVLIPNSSLLQDVLINWTHENNRIMSRIEFSAENSQTIQYIELFLIKILEGNHDILKKPSYKVLVKEFNDNNYVFEIEFWVDLIKHSKIKYISDKIIRYIGEGSLNNGIKVNYIRQADDSADDK